MRWHQVRAFSGQACPRPNKGHWSLLDPFRRRPQVSAKRRSSVSVFILLLLAVHICPLRLHAGAILREVWSDLAGGSVADLTSDPRYPNQPTSTNLVTDVFEAPIDVEENYGQRMHGYVLPPVTGDYTFWIATDDGGELWLSTDENPSNQRLIAYVTGWTSPREWTREANQQSAPVRLQANQAYYIAALQKEGGGGDNLAVRWLRPDGVDEDAIPATYLMPWGTVFVPPRILQQPVSVAAVEGGTASFTLQVDPTTPATVQWQRNGVNISGATSAALIYGPVTLADQGARFRAVLSNRLGSVTSAEASLSVAPDVTGPTVVSVLNLSSSRVRVIFSERVEISSATQAGNYRLSGGLSVSGAAFLDDEKTIVLTTSAMTLGSSYALTVANVRDRAASPNSIGPGTVVDFLAVDYVPMDIGTSGGTTAIVPGGYDVTGTGADLGGKADQCQFAYEERTGDFDYRVRVESLTIAHPFVQAGLMARDSLDPGARFAGIFTSSAQLGCFLESRSTASAASQIVSPTGGFPVNYPQMWLRLRRSGSQFSGFASFDGVAWEQLGAVTLALPGKLFFGMAASSHDAERAATARFRDLGPAANPTALVRSPGREWLGPSNRRTGLVLSEIMYHPADRADGKDLEFIEIYNGESIFIDLTGWRVSGGIEFAFPDGFQLQAGEFAVLAADPASIASVYGRQGVLGPYTGRLNNAGDTVRIRNAAGAVRIQVSYGTEMPWPLSADGLGHSLVLDRPSYGEDDARAWRPSVAVGGSPGEVDAILPNPWSGVVLNEFLAHTDDPVLDYIELYNASTASIDLSGCYISDDPTTNKFRIPEGTTLSARGFRTFDQRQLGFSFSGGGEVIYLLAADRSRVLDTIRFAGQENGVSSGRTPDGAPTIRRLATPTPGAANADWRVEAVTINEIMYHPISGEDADQYVELHNLGPTPVSLSGWRLSSGMSYQFPAHATLPSGGFVVVAKDAARLLTNYKYLTAANTFGDFSGSLSRSGERLVLSKPDTVVGTNDVGQLETNLIHIVVSEVFYREGGRWPELADGGGSSLELVDPRADTLRAANWKASDETQKASWRSFEYSGKVDLISSGSAQNRLQILMLGGGECLVDDVEVFRSGGTNLLSNGGFEITTGWTRFGNHGQSAIELSGAAAGQGCLHVKALGDGDTGANSIRANLASALTVNQNATIRAKVRWLAGWPEVLFRVRGNGIELPVRMEVPTNLGTPGLANSRRVANTGPAIYEVSHSPALPRANQAVVVTCRVSDPDGVVEPRLRFRADPATTLTTLNMRDDGAGGDALAGDGLFSATITGRSSGILIAFRIEASDDSAAPGSSTFPAEAPNRECLIRWDDPVPFGTFAHYHMWNTAAVESARNSSRALDNTFRDCTVVYGSSRIVYNAGFRDKGSPYHGGSGDYTVTVPADELLLGSQDRVFGSTGNGGAEGTGLRGDVSGWIGQQMGVPFLHSHYMRLFRNGSQFQQILYDLEQPNRNYAQDWFGGGDPGDDLFKIAVWFEFADDNSNFQANGATLERWPTSGAYKLARYRWNWQIRPSTPTVNDFTSIFNLVTAANNTADRVTSLMNLADMEQWMRVFAYNRVLGNWDSWTFSVGQNMYLYTPLGDRAVLMPWDIDFVLGDGNGPGDGLWGGQDPVANQLYNVPTYRRMLWRAYQDAIAGPMQPDQYTPQIDARRAMLTNNGVTGLADPRGVKTYLESRRAYLQNQLKAADAKTFAITSNGGTDFSTSSPTISLTGSAPFAVAFIEVNGISYPVTWTAMTAWRIDLPVGAPTNHLQLVGRDLRGNPVAGADASVTVRYTGTVPEPKDWVVINEIMYHAAASNAEFIELYNRHPSAPFDLSGVQISGVDFTFAPGTVIAAGGYLLVVQDRAAFAAAYGSQLVVAGEFAGKLDNGGETLRVLMPGSDGATTLIDDVRYDSTAPWPNVADGSGPSLQLVDPSQDNWRAGNWIATAVGNADQATPGRANAVRNALEAFPSLWINEVLPNNLTGPVDNQNEREPWIELYNAGSSALDLTGYFLSADGAAPAQWPFPAGLSLGSHQFLLLWADGQTAQSAGGAIHTNFRLNATNGLVTLSRTQAGGAAVMEYIEYRVTSADQAFGSVADGEPRKRRVLLQPTPGAPNNPNSPAIPVFINEWLASNRNVLVDPADSDFDDWFELYNAGGTTVDLSGYYLTGNLTNKTQFRIPDGTFLAPGGYRLFWADQESSQTVPGADVHVDFRLPAEGGQIGLYGLDEALIDSVSFGAQTANISQGRVPDGGAGPYFFIALPTPGAPNSAQTANRPPVIDVIPDANVYQGETFTLHIPGSDPDLPTQTLTYDVVAGPVGVLVNPSTGDLVWTPGMDLAPIRYGVTVRVTDNGTPARTATRSFNLTVVQINQAPTLAALPNVVIDETVPFTFRADGADSNLPVQKLTFTLGGAIPEGATVDAVTGEFSWTPREDQGPGSYAIVIRVTDDGQPPLFAEQSFKADVLEVNNAPWVTQISPQAIDEGTELRLQIEATDPDQPPATLTYTLQSGPGGVDLNSNTGTLTWTPGEPDGPRDYQLSVRVSETGSDRSTTMSFLVGVREVNTAPVLEPVGPFAVRPGDLLVFTNSASDSDLPRQTLAFAAVTPLPSGADLNSTTGLFTWRVPADPAGGTNWLTVRVTDDGSPSQQAERTIPILVSVSPRLAINEIMHRPATARAEFIELVNYSAANPVDLSGWQLEGYDFLIPAGTILEPGAYLCVARDLVAFLAAYGDQPRVIGNAEVTLPAEGGWVRLLTPVHPGIPAAVWDEVRFALGVPWPAAAEQGASLQLIDPNEDNSRVANWSASTGTVTNESAIVLPLTGSWKYWDSNMAPAAGWTGPAFNDATWPTGSALFYVESANLPATKSTPLTLGRTSYYFRSRFNFSGRVEGARLQLSSVIDDGAVFYLNGQEVYRLGMPEGSITSSTFASRTVGDAAVEGIVDLPATTLRQGENELAVEVHQANSGSSDVVFGAEFSLVTVAARAFTPGVPNSGAGDLDAFPPVWINEVLPSNTAGALDNAGEREPWIELFNSGTNVVSLDGWALTDDYTGLGKWLFPSTASVPPRGFLLVWADGEPFETTTAALHCGFRLSSSDGVVALSRAQRAGRAVVDYLEYHGLTQNQSWGSVVDGAWADRQRLTSPSPGAPNSDSQPTAPILTVPRREGAQLRFSCTTTIGARYQLQVTSDLTSGSWQGVTDFVGDGTEKSLAEPISGSEPRRFYRVLAQ